MKKWPEILYEDIVNYFVFSLGVDGSEMRNYKSTEAYQYFHSGKVGQVLIHCLEDDNLVFLKANVMPSQSKKHHLSAWVLVSSVGTVETAGCTCVAGRGKSCSHAAAILWKVKSAVSQGLTGVSCTDEQCQWNSGTQRNLAPKRLSEINFRVHKPSDKFSDCTPATFPSLPPTPVYYSHDALKKSLDGANFPVGSLLHKCVNAKPANPVPAAATQLQQPHGEHSINMQCQKCLSFYDVYVKLDACKYASLEEVTKAQSASHVWYDARKLRITASSAKKVPVRTSTNPDNFVREHLFPRFHGNSATKYGSDNEQVAYKWMESCGFSLESRGTVVSAKEPWLSASPDGVLVNSHELLEIKCPILKGESLTELFSGKLTDVKLVDGIPMLQPKGARGYYMQVQMGMFCTGLESCKLLVWSPSEQVLIDVPFDVKFCADVIPKLKAFYLTHMLPRIVDEFQSGRLTLCSKYVHLCGI